MSAHPRLGRYRPRTLDRDQNTRHQPLKKSYPHFCRAPKPCGRAQDLVFAVPLKVKIDKGTFYTDLCLHGGAAYKTAAFFNFLAMLEHTKQIFMRLLLAGIVRRNYLPKIEYSL